MKAKELDPDNSLVYVAIGNYAFTHGDLAGARRAAETVLSLEPRNPSAYGNLAVMSLAEGEPRRVIELLTQAINLDPKHPDESTLLLMGSAYFMLGDNDEAIKWCLRAIEKNATFPTTYAYLAMAYALKGEDPKARAAAAELRRLDPNIKLSTWKIEWRQLKEYDENKLAPAWRKAGLPE